MRKRNGLILAALMLRVFFQMNENPTSGIVVGTIFFINKPILVVRLDDGRMRDVEAYKVTRSQWEDVKAGGAND